MTRLARTLTKITGVLALSIVGSLVGSSCSTSPHPATVVEIATQLTSQQRTLHTVGANAENVYGWNQLTGTAEVDGATVGIEMLANVNYLKGSGEFFGFVTLTFADGATVGVQMNSGRTTAATEPINASFTSPLTVINGTGRYAGVTGTGGFSGQRKDALGGVVDSRFNLALRMPGK